MKLIARILINAVALWAAARLIPGISLNEEPTSILLVAAVFGLVNALLRPLISRAVTSRAVQAVRG